MCVHALLFAMQTGRFSLRLCVLLVVAVAAQNRTTLVDGIDLGLLLAAWASNDPNADLDGNGVVNGADLGLMFAAWSAG